MNANLIDQRLYVLARLRLKRRLQDAYRRGQLKKGELRTMATSNVCKATNIATPVDYLMRMADFTREQAEELCAEEDDRWNL